MKRCQLFCLQGTFRYLKYQILFNVSAVSHFFCQRRCDSVNALFFFVLFCLFLITGADWSCLLLSNCGMGARWRHLSEGSNCVSSLRVLLQGWRSSLSRLKNFQTLENEKRKKTWRSCRKVWTDYVVLNLTLSAHTICDHCCSVELQEAADVLLIPKIQIQKTTGTKWGLRKVEKRVPSSPSSYLTVQQLGW